MLLDQKTWNEWMGQMKKICFSRHALEQMADRGTNQTEVEVAIREGEEAPAKKGRKSFRKNFAFEDNWKGHYYDLKQVVPILAEERDRWVVVTVYVFYIGGGHENKI